jgi:hypothetical protein
MWEKNEKSYQILKKDPAHYNGHSHRPRHYQHQYQINIIFITWV